MAAKRDTGRSGGRGRGRARFPDTFELRTAAHFEALRSGLRRVLVRVAGRMGEFSVGDLSERTGRRKTGLYRHVKILVDAGLFVEVGERGEGRKREQIYRTAARAFTTTDAPLPSGVSGALADAIATDLRLADRCVRRALESGDATAGGASRDTWCGTTFAWLTTAQLRELNRMAMEMLERCDDAHPRPGTRHMGVSVVVYPIDLEDEDEG